MLIRRCMQYWISASLSTTIILGWNLFWKLDLPTYIPATAPPCPCPPARPSPPSAPPAAGRTGSGRGSLSSHARRGPFSWASVRCLRLPSLSRLVWAAQGGSVGRRIWIDQVMRPGPNWFGVFQRRQQRRRRRRLCWGLELQWDCKKKYVLYVS